MCTAFSCTLIWCVQQRLLTVWAVDIRPRRPTCNVISVDDGIRFAVDMEGQVWTRKLEGFGMDLDTEVVDP